MVRKGASESNRCASCHAGPRGFETPAALRRFSGGGERMPVDITVKLLNSRELKKQLRKNREQWVKAVDRTVSDMRRRGPTIVKDISSSQYAIAKNKLNPNTKAGRKIGSVSLSGGLTELRFVYTGGPVNVTEFKGLTKPRAAVGNGYKIGVRITTGARTILGHWRPPGTEGGKYSGRSPRMYIGVKNIKGAWGPVQREGSGWKGGAFGPSVPQMVANEGNGTSGEADPEMERLTQLMYERFEHNLRQCGLM